MTDELQRLLHGEVPDVVLAPGVAARALAGARRQQRRQRVLICAVGLALVAAGSVVTALARGGGGSDALVPAVPAPLGNADLLLHEGEKVTGTGRIVQVPGRTPQLCGSRLADGEDIAYPAGQEPAPRPCLNGGVDLQGIDLSTLSGRREKGGAIEGEATISGTYRAGVVTVEDQAAPAYPSAGGGTEVDFARPPCPAPAGGWPDSGSSLDTKALDAFHRSHPGLVSMYPAAVAHPRPQATVLVVLARDEQARTVIEEGLRPSYGQDLCVLVTRHSAAEVKAAHDDVSRSFTAVDASSAGTFLDADWQEVEQVDLLLVDDAALALADRHPDGLITLNPALRPRR